MLLWGKLARWEGVLFKWGKFSGPVDRAGEKGVAIYMPENEFPVNPGGYVFCLPEYPIKTPSCKAFFLANACFY